MNIHLERSKQAQARDRGYHAALDWLARELSAEFMPLNPFGFSYDKDECLEWRNSFDDTVARFKKSKERGAVAMSAQEVSDLW